MALRYLELYPLCSPHILMKGSVKRPHKYLNHDSLFYMNIVANWFGPRILALKCWNESIKKLSLLQRSNVQPTYLPGVTSISMVILVIYIVKINKQTLN